MESCSIIYECQIIPNPAIPKHWRELRHPPPHENKRAAEMAAKRAAQDAALRAEEEALAAATEAAARKAEEARLEEERHARGVRSCMPVDAKSVFRRSKMSVNR